MNTVSMSFRNYKTYLVNWFDDPVDPGVAANSLVLRIHEDHLKVLVGRVLIDPVRVQYTQITAALAHTLLRS